MTPCAERFLCASLSPKSVMRVKHLSVFFFFSSLSSLQQLNYLPDLAFLLSPIQPFKCANKAKTSTQLKTTIDHPPPFAGWRVKEKRRERTEATDATINFNLSNLLGLVTWRWREREKLIGTKIVYSIDAKYKL